MEIPKIGGVDLGDFVKAGSTHCLRRCVGTDSLVLSGESSNRNRRLSAGASRSQSPGLLLRPSPRSTCASPRLSQRVPRAQASAHFWQPWMLGAVAVCSNKWVACHSPMAHKESCFQWDSPYDTRGWIKRCPNEIICIRSDLTRLPGVPEKWNRLRVMLTS